MSMTMDENIKRWTARRKTALVIEIIQGKTTVTETSRAFDLSPSEIEGWIEDAKRGMENFLQTNPLYIREQYETQLKDPQDAYGSGTGRHSQSRKLSEIHVKIFHNILIKY